MLEFQTRIIVQLAPKGAKFDGSVEELPTVFGASTETTIEERLDGVHVAHNGVPLSIDSKVPPGFHKMLGGALKIFTEALQENESVILAYEVKADV